jgi:DNA-binding XRE family transcriptional regulator
MAPPLTFYGPDPTRNLLTAARLDSGWSQGELGRRAGVSRETVCRLERGYEHPSWHTVAKLAAALERNPLDLFYSGEGPADSSSVPAIRLGGAR